MQLSNKGVIGKTIFRRYELAGLSFVEIEASTEAEMDLPIFSLDIAFISVK